MDAAARPTAGESVSPEEIESVLAKRVADALSDLGLVERESEAFFGMDGRGRGLNQAAGGDTHAAGLAREAVVAHALAALAAGRRLTRRRVERLVRRLAEAGEVPADVVALRLFLQASREPHLLELPPDQAIERQLRLLETFGLVGDASLWAPEPNGRLRCVLHLGSRPPTRRVRAKAREALEGSSDGSSGQAFIHAVPVLRWGRPVGALVFRARPEDRESALVFAEEAAATLASFIERQALLERSAEGEMSLVESSERRLTRLGFDLHDGPIQELAALAGDIRLFRRQLTRVVARHEHADVILGRVDDLEARLVELDRELREMAGSAESSALLSRPLADLLASELQALSSRREIETELEVSGRLVGLTASQRIALVRVVQEASTNVLEHSDAGRISVKVRSGATHISVEVTDDGRGFDVERTLVQAARKGRLGLVGMSERVRMLGGRFDIQSARGGPTTISATIPRWRPLDMGAAEAGSPGAISAER